MGFWAQLKEAMKPMPMDGTGMCRTWGHQFIVFPVNGRTVIICPRCGEQKEVK